MFLVAFFLQIGSAAPPFSGPRSSAQVLVDRSLFHHLTSVISGTISSAVRPACCSACVFQLRSATCDSSNLTATMSHRPSSVSASNPAGFFPSDFSSPKSKPPAGCNRNRRRDRLLLPRQRPRSARNQNPSSPPQKRRNLRNQFHLRQQTPAKIFAAVSETHLRPIGCEKTALQLPAYVDRRWVEAFKNIRATNVADFCLEMYRQMGLLEGIRVVRSSDPDFRRAACDVADFFVDVPYEGEIVRARVSTVATASARRRRLLS